jgi:hypothetical protein
VKWNKSPPPLQQSQDSFEPEAYWVGWKQHAQGDLISCFFACSP